jgi:hypothetical protein
MNSTVPGSGMTTGGIRGDGGRKRVRHESVGGQVSENRLIRRTSRELRGEIPYPRRSPGAFHDDQDAITRPTSWACLALGGLTTDRLHAGRGPSRNARHGCSGPSHAPPTATVDERGTPPAGRAAPARVVAAGCRLPPLDRRRVPWRARRTATHGLRRLRAPEFSGERDAPSRVSTAGRHVGCAPGGRTTACGTFPARVCSRRARRALARCPGEPATGRRRRRHVSRGRPRPRGYQPRFDLNIAIRAPPIPSVIGRRGKPRI